VICLRPHDRKSIPDTRKGFKELDARGLLDALSDTVLKRGDFFLDEIEQDELLPETALGFGRELEESELQPTAAGLGEQLFAILNGECKLGEGGVDAVFEGVAELGESLSSRQPSV
jgi:hypothetical protein